MGNAHCSLIGIIQGDIKTAGLPNRQFFFVDGFTSTQPGLQHYGRLV